MEEHSFDEIRRTKRTIKDDYFDGDCPIDVKVKVLKQPGTETVSGQYIGFGKVYY